MTPAKQRLSHTLQESIILSYWAAACHSRILGIGALAHRIAQIGRCHISISAKIIGWANCSFGRNAVIGARTWINVNERRRGGHRVVVGENTFIGQDNFITAGDSVRFGPYCLTTAHCSFVGSSHIIDDPLRPYATTGTTAVNCIDIGANCFFGTGAMVLGNVKIGHGSIIGTRAVVRDDVPPFSIVAGDPARIVKHYDFTNKRWEKGERPLGHTDGIPSEDEYIGILKQASRFPLQPISASSAWLGDV